MIRNTIATRETCRPGRRAMVLAWLLILTYTSSTVGQEPLPPGFRPLNLRNASAAEIAPQVQQWLREMEPTAEVLVDRNTNRLLVRGSDALQQLASQYVQTLDRPPQDAGAARPPLRVRGYPVPREKLEATTRELQQVVGSVPGVRIASDERTSQVVVVAPESLHNEIARRLAQSSPTSGPTGSSARGTTAPANNVTSVGLRQLSWQDFEDYLRDSWGDQLRATEEQGGRLVTLQIPTGVGEPVVLQVERPANVVHIFGSPQAQRSWRQVIEALDQVPVENDATRLLAVRNADPRKITQTIALLKDATQRAEADQAVAQLRLTAGNGKTTVSTAVPQEAGQPAPAGDQAPDANQPPPAAAPGPEGEGTDEEAALLGNVQIEYVPELGIIVIRGPRRAVERVRRIISEIEEVGKVVQPDIEIITLKYVNSQALATLIVELYDQVFAPRQGPLSITSLDKPNALLLIGRKETMEVVRQLIEKLDQPVPATTQLRAFHLKHISAVDAEQLVRGFFVNQPGGGAAGAGAAGGDLRPGLGTRARVIADYRSNSLIVQAAPRDMTEVAYFIESIDRESPDSEHEIRIFRLKHTLAGDVAPLLQSAIAGTQVQAGQAAGAGGFPAQPQAQPGQAGVQSTRPSTRLSIIGIDAAGNRVIDSGVLVDVTVSADATANAVVVRGPSRSMNLIEELIKQLDQPPSAEAQVKVFHIENGDATSLTAMLQTLFGLQVTATSGNLGTTLQQAFGGFGAAATAPGSESTIVPLRFAVDVRTNSIIASGSPGDLQVVEVLILRLDESDVNTRKMFVYRLKNAPAQDVANSITQFLTSQRAIYQQNLLFNQSVSQIEQLERDIIVVPELVSNSLIVSVTPRYYEQIMEIIQSLDFRPPMVMVQVMICEVTLSDAFEFGVELGLQDSLVFDRSVAAGSSIVPSTTPNTVTTATRETLAGQAITGLNVGRSSASLGYGGLVLSAANESVNVLIRALQDAGRLQLLSRPQVMTLNNQVAFVQVGARVPRIVGSNITPQGGVQNQTADTDVGLVMRIQPRINEDGLVVMNIDAEKSEVGPVEQGIPVAVDVQGRVINSPQINTTTAQTTISAHSGQTVVFAGLITKNRVINTKRVPFISDIPIVGRLFRFDVETDKRTELLIFMTPYIIKDDVDYDWLKHVESERMSWCLADLVEMHGDVGLSGGHGLWGPAAAPVIFPDLDPLGTESVPPPAPVPAAPVPDGLPPSMSNNSSRRGTQVHTVKTWLGPAPQERPTPTLAAPGQFDGPVRPAAPVEPTPSAAWQPARGTSQPTMAPQGIAPANYQSPSFGRP